MRYIELFAGCGGLSLGLESVGFKLLFANELSPMASETFAYNLLGDDLSKHAELNTYPSKTFWISSRYDATDLSKRLRENPQEYPEYSSTKSDLGVSLNDIYGKLIVGSITELNNFLAKNINIAAELKMQNVDLISGGPPCQSFSLAGLRQHDNSRNTLPMEFADFVFHVKPKIALLENVSGILRAFNLPDGKHYAWFEVARAFASKGYYPLCLHINAKNACVPQNRPRFIMIAFREDIFKKVTSSMKSESLISAFRMIDRFFKKEQNGILTEPFLDLHYYDIEKDSDIFSSDILSPLNQCKDINSWHTVKDAIDDLRENNKNKGENKFLHLLNKTFPKSHFKHVEHNKSFNHELRDNTTKVKMRFKLYQHLSEARTSKKYNTIEKEVRQYLKKPTEYTLSDNSITFLIAKKYLSNDGKKLIEFNSSNELIKYLDSLATKKQTQRALDPSKPAPAALSIPDDACHYHEELQRTLTVREMARIQSFPDWFEFRSKVTTGGKMRRFEVPQYTQVGNAVPPLLGRALGKVVKILLNK